MKQEAVSKVSSLFLIFWGGLCTISLYKFVGLIIWEMVCVSCNLSDAKR
jgi:hypothetical protein